MIQTNMPEYFYCYSPNLFRFLTLEKGIRYICCALNENTKKKFWQYKSSPELNISLSEYRSMVKVRMGEIMDPEIQTTEMHICNHSVNLSVKEKRWPFKSATAHSDKSLF